MVQGIALSNLFEAIKCKYKTKLGMEKSVSECNLDSLKLILFSISDLF